MLDEKEKLVKQKVRIRREKILKQQRDSLNKAVYFFSMYKKYKNYYFLPKNNLFYSLVLRRFFKGCKDIISYSNIFCSGYEYNFDGVVSKLDNENFLDIISIYVILCRNNIFITLVKNNNKILKVFSSGLFRHISKKGRKRSTSFFYTVKRCLNYLNRFIFYKKKRYFFKIYFKGFQKFRRPLISRFLYKKGLKLKCLGIFNLDFEPFNGCRLRKSKRIKIRGQRKQNKKFSL